MKANLKTFENNFFNNPKNLSKKTMVRSYIASGAELQKTKFDLIKRFTNQLK